MSLTKSFIALLILTCTCNVYAATSGEALVTCLTDSTTEADRKDLARWAFTSLSTHPAVPNTMPADNERQPEEVKKAGEIFNRLLIEDCKAEVLQTEDKRFAVKKAFDHLSRVGMVELINHQKVKQSMQGISLYIDLPKIQQLFTEEPEEKEAVVTEEYVAD